MTDIKVRIAPSPTGEPHVGTAYIGLFNLAFARKMGGKFILRMEDTDQSRSHPRYEQKIYDALKWVGIQWDEGPDVGGPNGPYRQSERTEIYREHVDKLIEAGAAYRCFCTPEELAEMRETARVEGRATTYDRRWRDADPADVKAKLDSGVPFVVRFKMPLEGKTSFEDKLRGAIEFDNETQEDLILLKSDGFPTYHLANVVDDHLMEVTHVIRGEEWIPSTTKHVLLYEAFGWQAPEFWHMPLLLNPDRSKLSKRKNPTSVVYYKSAGILPEALLNFLSLMSYTRPNQEEEKFSFADFCSDFDLTLISLGGAVFDRQKLNWLNGRYIREDYDAAGLLQCMKDWMLSDEKLTKMLPLMQQRMESLGDFMQGADFFFFGELNYDAEALIPKKGDQQTALNILHGLMWEAEGIAEWNAEAMKALAEKVAEAWELKIRDVTHVMFVSIMGKKVGPPVFDSMEIIGSDLCRARLMEAIDMIGAPGNKALKKLRKEWDGRIAGLDSAG